MENETTSKPRNLPDDKWVVIASRKLNIPYFSVEQRMYCKYNAAVKLQFPPVTVQIRNWPRKKKLKMSQGRTRSCSFSKKKRERFQFAQEGGYLRGRVWSRIAGAPLFDCKFTIISYQCSRKLSWKRQNSDHNRRLKIERRKEEAKICVQKLITQARG